MADAKNLSDAQWGVLLQISDYGPLSAVEIMGPRRMDGSRKITLECHALTAATLDNLCRRGLVHVERGETTRPTNAVGKKGHARTVISILLTDAGRDALK